MTDSIELNEMFRLYDEASELNKVIDLCNDAVEVMKKNDFTLIKVALKVDFLEYRRLFYKTLHKIIEKDIMNDSSLENFYNTHRDVVMEKFREYSSSFLAYVEDTKRRK